MDVLREMRTVVAIAEKGSLTSAAEHLGTSAPTVVRILAAAEQRLGVRFFDRTTRQVRITDEGLIFVESARRVLDAVSGLEDQLRDRSSEPVGALTITAPVLFGRLHVTPVLNEFLRCHPRVNARLLLVDRVVDLTEEGVDVAVRIGEVRDLGLVATRVGQVSRCVCASPAFLRDRPAISSPSALANLPFIQHSGLVPAPTLSFGASGDAAQDVRLQDVRLVANSVDAALSACIAGIGVGAFLSYQVREAVDAGRLIVLLREAEPDPLPVSIVYAPSRRSSARSQAFIAMAKLELSARLAS
jgi:DNA-binding transcriptional LysR family regulator